MSARVPRRLAALVYLVNLLQLVALAVGLAATVPKLRQRAAGVAEAIARYVLDEVSSRLDAPAALRSELQRAQRELGAAVTLYDRSGEVLASNVEPPLARKGGVGEAPLVYREELWRDGALEGFGVCRLPEPAPLPLEFGFMLALALLVVSLSTLLTARLLLRPLAELAATTRRFGAGDLQARANYAGRDELGAVTQAFNDMAGRIAALLRGHQELLASVSHELRTPLARIRVALELGAEGDAAAGRHSLGEISTDLTELEELVGDVLSKARLDLLHHRAGAELPLSLARLAPAEVLRQSEQRFRRSHPQRQLVVGCPPDLPLIEVDPVLMRRALDNLLDNADKYSERDRPIALRALRVEDRIFFEVQDRGLGLSLPVQARLGTPFFRADGGEGLAAPGLGLGVAWVRRIVEAHRGAFEVESVLGEGTLVRLIVPVAR